MRLSPINTSISNIQNNYLKDKQTNKQNGLSFKGMFRIGKNTEDAEKIVNRLKKDSNYKAICDELSNFIEYCEKNTPFNVSGYITLQESRSYDYDIGYYGPTTYQAYVYDSKGKYLTSGEDTAGYYTALWEAKNRMEGVISANFCGQTDPIKAEILNELGKYLATNT